MFLKKKSDCPFANANKDRVTKIILKCNSLIKLPFDLHGLPMKL